MQIQPDYSHQLEEIAKALNRPSIPSWLVALISALVGAVFALAGQLLLKSFDNWRGIHNMRRVLYRELITMFQMLDASMGYTGLFSERNELLQSALKFSGEAYLKAHQDVYMQLPEREAAEVLYAAYHKILDHESSDAREHNWELAKRLLAQFVETDQLPRRYIKKFLGSAETEQPLKKLHAIYEDSERRT